VRVTVCELPHDPAPLAEAWADLAAHTREAESELIVLPEMPFSIWLAATKEVDPDRWSEAVADHERWQERFDELTVPVVIGARPVVVDGTRHNEGFVWERGRYTASHHKYYLPDEDGFWEATWYDRGPAPEYPAVATEHTDIGILLCTEVWFTEHARALGRRSIGVLATPRATEWDTRERWLMGGRAAAVMAGAFSLSSNHSGSDAAGMHWGGFGWIIDPNGAVLATTEEDEPFVTLDIDLLDAERAKATYPRYVTE
jgi:N-carbamoylputrescine amidase